jgi:uncharacterized protein
MILPPLLLLLPILFLGSVFSTISGGGLAIVIIIVGSFFLDIKTNVAITAILGTTIQMAKILHFHGHIRWPIVRWYVLAGIPMAFLGGYLFFFVPSRVLEVTLGLIFLGRGLWGMWPHKKPKIHWKPLPHHLLQLGAVDGLVGGLIGNSFLIRSTSLLVMGLRKEEFVGTSTTISFLIGLAKGSVYASGIEWNQHLLLIYVCAIPVVLIGVGVGKHLLKYVSVNAFEMLQNLLMIVGALRLLLM